MYIKIISALYLTVNLSWTAHVHFTLFENPPSTTEIGRRGIIKGLQPSSNSGDSQMMDYHSLIDSTAKLTF